MAKLWESEISWFLGSMHRASVHYTLKNWGSVCSKTIFKRLMNREKVYEWVMSEAPHFSIIRHSTYRWKKWSFLKKDLLFMSTLSLVLMQTELRCGLCVRVQHSECFQPRNEKIYTLIPHHEVRKCYRTRQENELFCLVIRNTFRMLIKNSEHSQTKYDRQNGL